MFRPTYLSLGSTELHRRADRAVAALAECRACPRDCEVNRLEDKWAACKTGRYAQVSSYFPHFGEEDCLRGWRGSGTIFFGHCNLRCVFCQNYDISQAIRPGSPEGHRAEAIAAMMLELQDHAFSTAGDYARSYVSGGKRYHHIIDPRTGFPATACRSVTIWANDATTADVVDDAVFILGPEQGLPIVESLEGVGAVIVDARNKVWISKRLEGKVKILSEPTDGI